MKQENSRLQNIVDNQKYFPVADIERINHEKGMNCSRQSNKLTKDLEAEQQQLWNEELKYARGKRRYVLPFPEQHLVELPALKVRQFRRTEWVE